MGNVKNNAVMRANIWQPGQSGNPAGRPKYKSFEETVRVVLAEQIDGVDKFEILARVVVDEAIFQRNTQVLKILAERLWPVSKVIDLNDHREPPEIKQPPTLEHMRETLRIIAEVVDVDAEDEAS